MTSFWKWMTSCLGEFRCVSAATYMHFVNKFCRLLHPVFAKVIKLDHWLYQFSWSKLKFTIISQSILCQSHGRNMCICCIISEIELSFTSNLNDFQRNLRKKFKFLVFSKSFISEIHDLFCYIQPVTYQNSGQKILSFHKNLYILRPGLRFNAIKVVLKSDMSNKKESLMIGEHMQKDIMIGIVICTLWMLAYCIQF